MVSVPLREKCPNTEFFLVLIFPHSDWIRRDTERYGKNSVFGQFSRSVRLPNKNLVRKFSNLAGKENHCVKSVRFSSFSGPYFPAFGLNTEGYGVSLCIQCGCGKIQTCKTRNTDTFHTVSHFQIVWLRKQYYSLFFFHFRSIFSQTLYHK